MRGRSGTLPNVSPRAQNTGDDRVLAEVERLGLLRRETDSKLQAAVLHALDSGSSVRVVAAAAQLSTATVQQWKAKRQR